MATSASDSAELLRQLAQRAAKQPALPDRMRFDYIRTKGRYRGSKHLLGKDGTLTLLDSQVDVTEREFWIAADGSGRISAVSVRREHRRPPLTQTDHLTTNPFPRPARRTRVLRTWLTLPLGQTATWTLPALRATSSPAALATSCDRRAAESPLFVRPLKGCVTCRAVPRSRLRSGCAR